MCMGLCMPVLSVCKHMCTGAQTGGEGDGSKGRNGRFTSLPGSSLCMREMQSVSAKEV